MANLTQIFAKIGEQFIVNVKMDLSPCVPDRREVRHIAELEAVEPERGAGQFAGVETS
jgi:hypothetical protein